MKMTKKSIICAIIIGVVAITGISIPVYKNYKDNQLINKYKEGLSIEMKSFEENDSRDEKIKILKSSIEKRNNDYKTAKQTFKEVDTIWDNNIETMQKYFKDDYNNQIKEATLKDLDKINKKDVINLSEKKLKAILNTIKSEENIVCSTKEVKDYDNQINTLVKSYDNRITAIKKAEAEAAAKKKAEEEKKKKEAEAKKKAEAEKKKKEAEAAAAAKKAKEEAQMNQQNQNYNNYDYNYNNGYSNNYNNNNYNNSKNNNSNNSNNSKNNNNNSNNNNNNSTNNKNWTCVITYDDAEGKTYINDNTGDIHVEGGQDFNIADVS